MFQTAKQRRGARQRLLLAWLAAAPGQSADVATLSEVAELGQAVYPLLVELKRLELIEQSWEGGRLSYRLTQKGLEQLKGPQFVVLNNAG